MAGKSCGGIFLSERESMKLPSLQKRLSAAIPFVRKGTFLADVGTDHAYLPVYLYGVGHIRGAIASDINEKPLRSAQKHIAAYGADGVSTLLCDGLAGIEAYSPEDITVFGMGGELIARILEDAPFVKDPKVRLILQPMSRAEDLRSYLAREGFAIIGESLCAEGQRIYQIICAEYDGKMREISAIEALLGKENIERGGELFLALLGQKKRIFENILAGKTSSGEPIEYEKEILFEIEKLLLKESKS